MEENKPTAEELAAEQEGLKPIDEAAVREQVVAELGFDEVEDADKISKAVAREVKQREITQKAIQAKIKQREGREAAEAKLKEKSEEKPPAAFDPNSEEFGKAVESRTNAVLDQRDLEALGYPDELNDTIKKVAKNLGISIREALKDDYVKSKIDAHTQAQEAEEGAVPPKHKSGGKKGGFDFNNPPVLDPEDPKSVKEYEAWQKAAIEAGH